VTGSASVSGQVLVLFALAWFALSAAGGASRAQGGGTATVNRDAALQAEFQKRAAGYMQLRNQLKAKLPKLSGDATPQQMDLHQRTLEKLIAAARSTAKPGDLFTSEMQTLIRARFAELFKGERMSRIR